MHHSVRHTFTWIAAVALVGVAWNSARSETIIKLGLGNDAAADIDFDGTNLKTIADNDVPPTTGDQNTRIDFLGFLDGEPDVNTPTASFTLKDVAASGLPTVLGGVVFFQDFTGGEMFLYDPSNVLLLSGTLDDSVLSGSIGPPGTGALFTTTFGSVTGGTLAQQIDLSSLSLSVSLTGVNNGQGFSLNLQTEALNRFTADVTLNIAALPVPEPPSSPLALLGGVLMVAWTLNCRSRMRPATQSLPTHEPRRLF